MEVYWLGVNTSCLTGQVESKSMKKDYHANSNQRKDDMTLFIKTDFKSKSKLQIKEVILKHECFGSVGRYKIKALCMAQSIAWKYVKKN